ncbi:hypothetical protein PIB30_072057 [Stylosanthes scabra]|uniref:Uncharacterized protein n=1 Tax=Stylosanthes scabra TaxID=79078 RepID=A0ABU6QR49_9FABA|nr:hypothetical protein [Stylosanthes scabra]
MTIFSDNTNDSKVEGLVDEVVVGEGDKFGFEEVKQLEPTTNTKSLFSARIHFSNNYRRHAMTNSHATTSSHEETIIDTHPIEGKVIKVVLDKEDGFIEDNFHLVVKVISDKEFFFKTIKRL